MGSKKIDNPFILWESYNNANKDFFFGRDEEVRALRQALSNNHVVFYGPSGSGKTSICRAGLSPGIYIEDYTTRYLKEQFGIEENSYAELDKIISGLGKPLIILDQFEKVFYDREANLAFIEYLIERYVRSNIARIIITIREENIGDLFKFSSDHQFALLSDKTGFYLRKMERSGVIDVLSHIFSQSRVNIKESTVALIVDTIQSATGSLELADIQAAGYEIFKHYSDKMHQITADVVFDIIDGFYSRLYETLSDEEKWILKKGISSSGDRTKIPPAFYHESAFKTLLSRRILKKVGENFEIVHDYLLKKILERLTDEELSIIRVEELIERSYKDYEFNHSLLIDNLRLKDINKYRDKIMLNYGECELVTRSTMSNDLSPSNSYYWLMRLSEFFPQNKEFMLSILREGVMENAFKDSVNQIMTIKTIKDYYNSGKLSSEDFQEFMKLALLSRNKESLYAALNAIHEIIPQIVPAILHSLIHSPYFCKPEIYHIVYRISGSELVVNILKEWALSGENEKIRIAYEFLKANSIAPESIYIDPPDESDPSFLDYYSYLSAFDIKDFSILDIILEKLFSFDTNLSEYAKIKIREKNLAQEIFEYFAQVIEPPFECLFKIHQDFLDYEAFIHKKQGTITFLNAGIIDVKKFSGFTLISFNYTRPSLNINEYDLIKLLQQSGADKRYVISYSGIDLSSADITINILRSIASLGKDISVYSGCISPNLKKKLERFSDFAQSISINWVI